MKCQICNKTITPIKTSSIEILQCQGCNGFWVKRGDLNKLIHHQKGDLEFSSIDHHLHKDQHGIMKCIFCEDRAMIKINFLDYSDIILDFCEECGAFWIDSGELEKMQKYINSISDSEQKTIFQKIIEVIFSLPQI